MRLSRLAAQVGSRAIEGLAGLLSLGLPLRGGNACEFGLNVVPFVERKPAV